MIRPQYAPSCSVLAYQAYRYGIYYSSEKPLNWIIAIKNIVFLFLFFSVFARKSCWLGRGRSPTLNQLSNRSAVGGRRSVRTPHERTKRRALLHRSQKRTKCRKNISDTLGYRLIYHLSPISRITGSEFCCKYILRPSKKKRCFSSPPASFFSAASLFLFFMSNIF